ncbi:MAG: DNA polymerase Y family protein [Pseudomonadota bacterium]|nr:DNA polymerase Y family protein [Pseudomonadota bacterium]
MSRLVIHAWFPYLAAERLHRAGGATGDVTGDVPAGVPLVLTGARHGAEIVESVCRLARRRGLHAGMRLADARALCPELVSRDSDPAADAADLLHLARWARRYCPLTAPEQADSVGTGFVGRGGAVAHAGNGLWLDVAGAAHLQGGIRPLLADMARRLRQAGLSARLAVAPTCGAAWGLARYAPAARRYGVTCRDRGIGGAGTRQLAGLLADLPLAALRLDGGICTAMAASGLRRIGDITSMPRAPLAGRFGTVVTARLDAALGHVNESFTPIAPPRPRLAVQSFAEPILAPADIHAVVMRLVGDLTAILQQDGMAARRLQLGWQRVDGMVRSHDVRLSRPSRDAAAFRRLLADAGEAIDPEFGIERMWMEAHGCSPQAPVPVRFDEGLSVAESRAGLVDRLVARLGHGAVLHMKPRDSWQPEAAQYMAYPDMEPAGFSDRMNAAPHCLTAAPRPIRLLAHPHRLAVVALLPDHPPAQFVWQKRTHRIVRASGPERIAPQWWQAAAGTRTRDYFRLQDERGAGFWVYREGLPERGEEPDWFLHGFFA